MNFDTRKYTHMTKLNINTLNLNKTSFIQSSSNNSEESPPADDAQRIKNTNEEKGQGNVAKTSRQSATVTINLAMLTEKRDTQIKPNSAIGIKPAGKLYC